MPLYEVIWSRFGSSRISAASREEAKEIFFENVGLFEDDIDETQIDVIEEMNLDG